MCQFGTSIARSEHLGRAPVVNPRNFQNILCIRFLLLRNTPSETTMKCEYFLLAANGVQE